MYLNMYILSGVTITTIYGNKQHKMYLNADAPPTSSGVLYGNKQHKMYLNINWVDIPEEEQKTVTNNIRCI